jgi:hypothetical protein
MAVITVFPLQRTVAKLLHARCTGLGHNAVTLIAFPVASYFPAREAIVRSGTREIKTVACQY